MIINGVPAVITEKQAAEYFKKFKGVCEKDNGKLWNYQLYGPIMVMDIESNKTYANRKDKAGHLSECNGVFIGNIPKDIMVGNTVVEWNGEKWATVIAQCCEDDLEGTLRCLIHESWHRIQDEIGLPGCNNFNGHLDTQNGRYWLQLEWRGLRKALVSEGRIKSEALRDTLIYRYYRRSLFNDAAKNENMMETHEGMAAYTECRLFTDDDSKILGHIHDILKWAEIKPRFSGRFAYRSGPAYGILLDQLKIRWRPNLKQGDDLGAILKEHISFILPSNLREEAEKAALNYNSGELWKKECINTEERKKRIARYCKQLVDNPVLIIPMENAQFGYDPSKMEPLKNYGVLYHVFKAKDDWGVLEVEDGALYVNNSKIKNGVGLHSDLKVHVSVPEIIKGNFVKGYGYTLNLNDNWKIVPAETKGDCTLKQVN